jgi:hypothetical protein
MYGSAKSRAYDQSVNGSKGHFGDLRDDFLNDWFGCFFERLTLVSSILCDVDFEC